MNNGATHPARPTGHLVGILDAAVSRLRARPFGPPAWADALDGVVDAAARLLLADRGEGQPGDVIQMASSGQWTVCALAEQPA